MSSMHPMHSRLRMGCMRPCAHGESGIGRRMRCAPCQPDISLPSLPLTGLKLGLRFKPLPGPPPTCHARLKFVKFQSVVNLSIFVASNQGNEETTKVQKIAIFGQTGELDKFNVAGKGSMKISFPRRFGPLACSQPNLRCSATCFASRFLQLPCWKNSSSHITAHAAPLLCDCTQPYTLIPLTLRH